MSLDYRVVNPRALESQSRVRRHQLGSQDGARKFKMCAGTSLYRRIIHLTPSIVTLFGFHLLITPVWKLLITVRILLTCFPPIANFRPYVELSVTIAGRLFVTNPRLIGFRSSLLLINHGSSNDGRSKDAGSND